MAKTLKDFLAKHDPSFIRQDITTQYGRELRKGCDVFVITSAQNATPVVDDMFACLQSIIAHRSAELLVIPLRYQNPTSIWSGSQRNEEWFTHVVRPYLWNQRVQLNPNLTLLADIMPQASASIPLASLDAVSLASSSIVGHTKMQLRSVPTPHGRMAKLLTTTGACTEENYTITPRGKIGGFHHSLSALIVELDPDGRRFYLRQLHYSRKAKRIIDLGTEYTAEGHGPAPRALAVAKGDTHVDFCDPTVDRATHGEGGLLDVTNPENLFEHDLLDAYSCNPHHKGQVMNAVAKRLANRDSIKDEVQRAIDYVAARRRPDTVTYIVGSNHNDFLGRAVQVCLEQGFTKFGAINVPFLVKTADAQLDAVKLTSKGTEYPDALGIWLRRAKLKGVRVLDVDESLMLGGVEHGMHGNLGPNGARGSVRNLARIGVKSVTGHGHAPEIFEGHYRTGTSTFLKLEYNHGPSGWLNTHCVTNADGKRQLITIVDGKFRI
jgi:hypothetical protein